MSVKLILCADDYGQNADISQGIFNLVKAQRLSAVSCMVTLTQPEHAAWLHDFREQIDIGLHLNLTQGAPLTSMSLAPHGKFSPLGQLMIKAHLRQLNKAEIHAEITKQLDYFVELYQQLPDFIDGHQHIHHLPIIRECLLEIYKKRLSAVQTYIRVASQHNFKRRIDGSSLKSLIIMATGALALKQCLKKERIPHNSSFAGIYNFSVAQRYSEIFPSFLTNVQDNSLIMCHPGLTSQDTEDPIYAGRSYEYEFLMSEAFLKLCAEKKIIISRFTH